MFKSQNCSKCIIILGIDLNFSRIFYLANLISIFYIFSTAHTFHTRKTSLVLTHSAGVYYFRLFVNIPMVLFFVSHSYLKHEIVFYKRIHSKKKYETTRKENKAIYVPISRGGTFNSSVTRLSTTTRFDAIERNSK